MSPALQELCFFYRNPPPDSGVKPQPYECDTPAQAPTPMAAWTVSQVVHWLESSDMAGPASILQMQGVSGEDLLGFATAAHFSRDVGLSMFAASKVLRLRDQHLVKP